MAFLIIDPTYPENEENYEAFREKLQKDLLALFPRQILEAVDAGPSASIPGWAVSIFAAGWFVFSAPSTINENLPLWKENFEMMAEFLKSENLSFSIDLHDACAAALHQMSEQFSVAPDKFKLISCTIHHANINGNWSSYYDQFEMEEPATASQKHEAACNQYRARYIFHIEYDYSGYTAAVEKNGDVVLISRL